MTNPSLENNDNGVQVPPTAEAVLRDVQQLLIEVRAQQKKIQHTLLVSTIGNYLRLFLVLIPLIIGVLFLPSLLSKMFEQMPPAQAEIFQDIIKIYQP